jgi:hypothetical protein
MREIGGLIADFSGDDLPPHGRFPFRRPLDLTTKQFRVGSAIIGQGDGTWLKLLIADQQQDIQLRHAPKRTGRKLRVPRRADDDRDIRQRHGFVRAAIQVRNVKLIQLDPDFQTVA